MLKLVAVPAEQEHIDMRRRDRIVHARSCDREDVMRAQATIARLGRRPPAELASLATLRPDCPTEL